MWGVLPVALSVVLEVLDVYTLSWFRFLVAFGLLFVYLSFRGKLPKLKTLLATPWNLLLGAAVFLAVHYLLFLQGLAETSAANAQVLIQLAPVLLGLGALVVFKERYTRQQWAGLGILGLGFGLFFIEQLQTLVTAPSQYLFGSGVMVIAAATWAGYALAQKQLLKTLPSTNVMLVVYGGCVLLLSPTIQPARLLTLDLWHGGVLLFCALNTVLAYGAFAEALEHWEASRVSAVLTLTPMVTLALAVVLSLLWPAVVTPERITFLGFIGVLLVVVGSITIALGRDGSARV
ncbi:MAG: DMT family transporter [Gemmatimonadaceae bacterium]|nr:DMT family transporter [Gloeobacterales cyanobacterium ES-bin-141]